MVFVTKFFELKDQHYFADGQIKIGTLREYGDAENHALMGARLDAEEGVLDDIFSTGSSNVSAVNIGGFINIAAGSIIAENNLISFKINEWIFCCSGGDYSIGLHQRLISKNLGGYEGNPKLLSFAVFDLKKLVNAICDAALAHPLYRCDFIQDLIYARMVSYGKTPEEIEMAGPTFKKSYNQISWEKYMSIVFKKPEYFKPENEYRIAVRMSAPLNAPPNAPPMYLKSNAIRQSIVKLGPF